MGESGLMEYQEREPTDHLPLEEHSLQSGVCYFSHFSLFLYTCCTEFICDSVC